MLKNTLTTSIKELFASRYLATLSIILVLLAVSFVLYVIFSVRPSELQLVTHYTAYGVTQLYRSQWWYLLSFALFGLLVAFFHIAVALKINATKGVSLAGMFLWLGIGILVFAWVTSFSIINIWSPV